MIKYSAIKVSELLKYSALIILSSVVMLNFSSCSQEELPGVGSIADKTPPKANFSFTQDEGDFKTFKFSNTSISATDFAWDFGDGGTSSVASPSHTYATLGSFNVTLTASDKLNVVNTFATTIEVVEPEIVFVPVIENPGFDIEGDDSYRDFWRNGDLGGVIQITSSPVHDGVKAAKFPSAGDRIAYQLIKVQKGKDYTVSFYYTMKTSPVGTMNVAILGGAVTETGSVAAATIASVTLNDQTDANTYVQGSVSFNSGDNDEVAILVTNADVECRIDTFSIIED